MSAGNFGRRCVIHIVAGLDIGAGECFGLIGFQPFRLGGKAGKAARANCRAKRGDDMTNAIRLKLLRGRALLVDILAGASPVGLVHFAAIASINDFDFIDINAALVTSIFKHCHRLAAMMNKNLCTLKLVPAKSRISITAGQEEPVHFIDLGKMYTSRNLALIEGVKPLTEGRLHNIGGTIIQCSDCGYAGRGNCIVKIQPLIFQKTAGHC